MKKHRSAAFLFLAASTVLAQTTGVSKPSAAVIETDPTPTFGPATPTPVAKIAKPSAANRVVTVDGNRVTVMSPEVAVDPSTAMTGSTDSAPGSDPDSRIVTSVSSGPNELAEGSLIKVRMDQEISTKTSVVGRPFTARIIENTLKNGKVIIPTGSQLQGHIVQLTSERRINGRASIRLRPDEVILPDGSRYMLHAMAIDSDPAGTNKVDNEGSILDKGHPKRDALVVGGVAAGSAATGAMVAGPPGAVVGAGVGAGVATTQWLLQEHDATLPKNAMLVFQLTEPMQMTPLRAETESASDPLLHERRQ